ncbi:centromere-associated protein E-like isoform X2 [Mercenaria mercenaria]|uniref:centromere-associated protein E-like isoform X2 n=1 Tax=Mercenaria mercenaria TaxID=6596 RepID=UPI00234F29F4|nr:centromere-associated protein E-like isoform X2 [Mercenaria mercenaria]
MSQEEGKFTDNSKDFGLDDEQQQTVSMESTDNTEFQGHSESAIVKSQEQPKQQEERTKQQEDCKENDKKTGKKNSQKDRYKAQIADLKKEKKSLEEQLEEAKRIKPGQEPCDCITSSLSLQEKLKAQLENERSDYLKQIEMMSREKRTAQQTQNDLHGEIDKLKRETGKLSKEISELKTEVSKLSEEKRESAVKLTAKEQEVKRVQEKYKIEKDQFEKLIQKQDKKIQGLTKDSDKKDAMLDEHVRNIGHLEYRLKNLQQTIETLRSKNVSQSETITTLNQEKEVLHKEKKSLLMRLSRCAGDNLTYQNPSIADLSDEKRPTKLAEEFSELYDNEWTDAFEKVNIEDDQGITTFMLQLLKRANELCNEVSENHAESIKRSLSSITVKSHAPQGHLNGRISLNTRLNLGTASKTEPDVIQVAHLEAVKDLGKQKNGTRNEEADSSEWNDNNITDTAGRGVGNVHGPAFAQNTEPDVDQAPRFVADMDGYILEIKTNNRDIDTANNTESLNESGENERREEIATSNAQSQERNDDEEPKRKRMRLESDFELLQKEQKKTIMEARKFFEVQLSEEVERAGSDIIVQELGIDQQKQGTVVSYIKKCMDICWSMCRHEPPVYVEFIDVGDDIPFDTNKYKPYTKSGKLLDYIVWPAVYLHKDGPMLAKGVAQGKA